MGVKRVFDLVVELKWGRKLVNYWFLVGGGIVVGWSGVVFKGRLFLFKGCYDVVFCWFC